MRAEILVTTKDGQVTAGTITLKNGKLRGAPEKGYERLVASILEDALDVDGKEVSAEKEPVVFLKALPKCYSGSYLRAKLYS